MALPRLAPQARPQVIRLSSSSYGVRLGLVHFAQFRSRGEARICARELRRFLTRVCQSTGVDVVTLTNQISVWFSSAVGTPGFVTPPPVIAD